MKDSQNTGSLDGSKRGSSRKDRRGGGKRNLQSGRLSSAKAGIADLKKSGGEKKEKGSLREYDLARKTKKLIGGEMGKGGAKDRGKTA